MILTTSRLFSFNLKRESIVLPARSRSLSASKSNGESISIVSPRWEAILLIIWNGGSIFPFSILLMTSRVHPTLTASSSCEIRSLFRRSAITIAVTFVSVIWLFLIWTILSTIEANQGGPNEWHFAWEKGKRDLRIHKTRILFPDRDVLSHLNPIRNQAFGCIIILFPKTRNGHSRLILGGSSWSTIRLRFKFSPNKKWVSFFETADLISRTCGYIACFLFMGQLNWLNSVFSVPTLPVIMALFSVSTYPVMIIKIVTILILFKKGFFIS